MELLRPWIMIGKSALVGCTSPRTISTDALILPPFPTVGPSRLLPRTHPNMPASQVHRSRGPLTGRSETSAPTNCPVSTSLSPTHASHLEAVSLSRKSSRWAREAMPWRWLLSARVPMRRTTSHKIKSPQGWMMQTLILCLAHASAIVVHPPHLRRFCLNPVSRCLSSLLSIFLFRPKLDRYHRLRSQALIYIKMFSADCCALHRREQPRSL